MSVLTALHSSFTLSAAAILSVCVFASTAQGATIHFKNGDRINGDITATTTEHVTVKSQFGTFEVPWDRITNLRADLEPQIQESEAEQDNTGAAAYPSAARSDIQASSAATQTSVTAAQTVAVIPASAPPAKTEKSEHIFLGAKWSGRADFGAGLQSGNSEKNNINANAGLKARWEDYRANIKAEYHREEEEDEITVNNKTLNLGLDYFYTEQWFMNSTLGFTQNDIQDLDLRTKVGLGIGHQAFETDELNLKYVIGATYLHESFENDDTEESLAAHWSFDYDQKIWDKAFQVFHNHDLLVPTEDTEDFLFESESGIRIPIKFGIVASGGIDFDWDNKPANDAKEEDVIYSVKLGYEW